MSKVREDSPTYKIACNMIDNASPAELELMFHMLSVARRQQRGEVVEPSKYKKPGEHLYWDGTLTTPAWFQQSLEQGASIRELVNPAWIHWRDETQGIPLYEDPENPFRTWNGRRYRGQIPDSAKWLRDKVEAGANEGDFLNPRRLAQESASRSRKVKFRNPENPLEQWHGCGKAPRWFEDLRAAGVPLTELRVDSEVA